MRRVIVLTIMLQGIILLSFGQNVKLSNLTVSNERSRTLFIGIENIFLVTDSAVTGIENQEHVNFSNGNKLEIKPVFPGYLTVTFLKNQEKAQVIFYVKTIPPIVPVLGNQKGSKVQKDSIMVKDSLRYITESNDVFYQGYKVDSFAARLNKKSFVCGPTFSEPLKKAIRKSKGGDSLEITEVKLFNDKLKKSFLAKGPYKYTLE